MKIDLHCLTDGSRGELIPGEWGDAKKTACLMSALTGETSVDGCVAQGWPQWLAELGTVIFDNAPESELLSRSIAFAEAVKAAEDRGADFDRVFRDTRLNAVLPIALEAAGKGNETWRVQCREAVQWSIDNDGQANPKAAEATKTAWAAWTPSGPAAARAAAAAKAKKAAGAASAVAATEAAQAAAHTRIFNATIEALRGEGATP